MNWQKILQNIWILDFWGPEFLEGHYPIINRPAALRENMASLLDILCWEWHFFITTTLLIVNSVISPWYCAKILPPAPAPPPKKIKRVKADASRHWTYHFFFDILSSYIIFQKNDIISFISYREKNDMIEYQLSFSYHFKKIWS
jgi:hypothetical protein